MAKRRRKNVQKAILAMIALYGSTAATSCCRPAICDPAPPPTMTEKATPTGTPMICDPAPPPTVLTLSPATPTPMICDPAPPPTPASPETSVTPMICDPPPPPATVAVGDRVFRLQGLKTASEPMREITVRGQVIPAPGRNAAALRLSAEGTDYRLQVLTAADGSFHLPIPAAGACRLWLEDDQAGGVVLQLADHDQVTITWMEVQPGARLPLAEIRHVRIRDAREGLFVAETPWPGAHLSWRATGGTLQQAQAGVRWLPPAAAGRFLIEVVADWGSDGLAADALTVAVDADGSVCVL
ncbi:MAG: hypothetical protein ACUVX9_05790 [Anaerolineae bacterium]